MGYYWGPMCFTKPWVGVTPVLSSDLPLPRVQILFRGSSSIIGVNNGERVYPNKNSPSCLHLHHRSAIEALDETRKTKKCRNPETKSMLNRDAACPCFSEHKFCNSMPCDRAWLHLLSIGSEFRCPLTREEQKTRVMVQEFKVPMENVFTEQIHGLK